MSRLLHLLFTASVTIPALVVLCVIAPATGITIVVTMLLVGGFLLTLAAQHHYQSFDKFKNLA